MESYYSNIWCQQVVTVRKLRTYVTLKADFAQEKYVQLNLNRKERSLFAQFRVGIPPLRIENGRYTGGDPVDRLCTLCNMNLVENETHFLVDCVFY